MSSANSFLSSTAYHASNARYASSQSPSSTSSSFNILSNSVQQQLNDLNSTRSSTSSCSTSHCLSNQCIECTTILSTRPSQPRCNLTSYTDQSSNSSHFVQNCSCVSNSTLDNHSQISTIDEQQSTRILSMNIPVDNSNNNRNDNPINSSSLNIEIEEDDDDDDDQRIYLLNEYNDQNEQLEVFVGFYRPGEYQRETMDDDDDDDGSEISHPSDAQKKEEQSTRELISDDDEGNEDQDFIDEDLCPNQDEDNDQQQQDNEFINEEQLNPNILNNDHQQFEANQQNPFPMVIVQIDEDEDQGFGAQFNDDCQSSDDENNHLSTISLNNNNDNDNENELIYTKKKFLQRSQSDSELYKYNYQTFLSLPSLSINSRNYFEKIEHIIIDDQQPITTISNLIIKKKQDDDNDHLFLRKKRILRKSSEEIIEISNLESSLQTIVDQAVRDVERHVMLWDDDHARQIDHQSPVQQIVQYFQLNIDINEDQQSKVSSIRKELLLDYLQYRSEADMSANDLHENLLQYPEYSSHIHCRFFPFWPPRDVDLLQWLSHWIKQGALPIAIMNMDHYHSQKTNFYSTCSSWQHRIIYGVEPRGIYLMNPIQIQSPQQVYEQLTVDSITYITRQEIVQRYNQSPMCLTPLAINNNTSRLFSDTRWRTMNVLGQVVNVLREDRQLNENETRNIPYRPTVTHVRIPSTCSSGILIFSKDYNQLINAIDLPLRQ
ncbi:unnamed protein product [Rotaria sp. Silwood1]|nr:unnamed protein product [Rotaria sp. Silwood1]CAF0745219.1 unnamed protein product [Rotaria sp. Silwood1]CAF3334985.1 unnamed protein product [Rotaria sp. Silwood1]CAF3347455.1 unnamed protein product [Rotaria sp. Silwood1]CAF4630328.1 unnamed protein product [Rotaria sp. Silwood1]